MSLTAKPLDAGRRPVRGLFTGRERRPDVPPAVHRADLRSGTTGQPLAVHAGAAAPSSAPALAAVPGASGSTTARRWSERYVRRLFVTDLLALVLAAAALHLIDPPALQTGALDGTPFTFVLFTAAVLVGWMLALDWFGSRDANAVGYGAVEYKRVLHATFAVFGMLAIASYFLKLELPRTYVLLLLPLGLAGLLASRYSWRRWLHRQRDAGRYLSQVLAVGNVNTVADLLRDLRRAPHAGYEVVGACVSRQPRSAGMNAPQPTQIDGVPVLGGLDDVAGMVRRTNADTVAVTSTASFSSNAVRKLSWELEDTQTPS